MQMSQNSEPKLRRGCKVLHTLAGVQMMEDGCAYRMW
jgi:hypothetical protein